MELALLGAFEDDEEALMTADAGAAEPSVSLLPAAPLAFAAYDPMRRISSGAEPSAARAAAAPLLPPRLPLFAPAGPVGRKTAHEKTREIAVAMVAAWVFSPDVSQRPGGGRWQLSLQPERLSRKLAVQQNRPRGRRRGFEASGPGFLRLEGFGSGTGEDFQPRRLDLLGFKDLV
jgi:hypothetical protein